MHNYKNFPFLTQSTYCTGPLVSNGVFTPCPGEPLAIGDAGESLGEAPCAIGLNKIRHSTV